MAPSKRVSSAAPKGRTNAKVAKVDPAIERVACVINMIDEFASELPAAATDMLRGMVPFALSKPIQDSHKYQADVWGHIEKIAADAAVACDASISAAEADVAGHSAEMQASDEVLSNARKVEEEKESAKNLAAEVLTEAQAQEAAARSSVKEAEAAVTAAEEDKQTAADAKTTFEESFSTTWKGLLDGSFAAKDWRNRNKAIANMVSLLKDAEAAESMRDAVSFALKEKPDVRGAFTVKALECADAQLQKHLDGLAARIVELETARAERAASVDDLTNQAETRSKEAEAALDKSLAAEKEWSEARAAVRDQNKKIKGFAGRTRELEKALADRQASKERLQELTVAFHALMDGTVDTASDEIEANTKAENMEVESHAKDVATAGA